MTGRKVAGCALMVLPIASLLLYGGFVKGEWDFVLGFMFTFTAAAAVIIGAALAFGDEADKESRENDRSR